MLKIKTNLSIINSYILVFSLITIVFLSLIRFSTLFLFSTTTLQSKYSVLSDLFIMGLRFDLRIVGIIVIVFVYLPAQLLLIKNKYQNIYFIWLKLILSISLGVIVLLSFTDLGYFTFFGTPIDILIFGLFEDDTNAVIKSGLSDTRLIIIGVLTFISIPIIIFAFLRLSKKLIARLPLLLIPNNRFSLLIIIPLLLVAARGSIDTFPLTARQSSISTNSFINSLVQNAIFHVSYAYSSRKENNFNSSSSAVLKKSGIINYQTLLKKAGYSKTHVLQQKTAISPFLEKNPPHVIFIQMEGWSTHIALKNSEKLPILGHFEKHANEDYFLTHFFSNRYGTNPTIENLLLNSPITPISQSNGYKTHFSTSNVLPFKNKGYETNFISGGYSSWRNHDVFWPQQGFNHYIDRSVIENKYHTKSDNPWGVYDEYLFKYLQDSLLSSGGKPTFNFVLTTNNHPPVRLPPNYNAPNLDISDFKFKNDIEHKKTILSAYHYQTNAFGEFMDWLKTSELKDNVIVVATGDHILKGFDNYNAIEKYYLRYAVATYLYIPEQYNQLKNRSKILVNQLSGSHADLFPTIFELSLSNASYYSFGTPLMKKNLDNAYGWIDQGAFITHSGIILQDSKKLFTWAKNAKELLYPIPKEPSKSELKLIEQEKYRKILKEWLLYRDKEKGK